MTDEKAEKIRNEFRAMAEFIFEVWQQNYKPNKQ